MEKQRRKQLREEYDNRHPDMGVVCLQCGDNIWAAISKDANADYNGIIFQLKLGSFPNREMQKLYKEKPDEFKWSLIKKLDYKDYADDHSEDLEILLMEFLDDYPEAKPMKPGQKLRKSED